MANATIKRALKKRVTDHHLIVTGKGKSTRYQISPGLELLWPIKVADYFAKEIDERKIQAGFNHNLKSNILAKSKILKPGNLKSCNHNNPFISQIAIN